MNNIDIIQTHDVTAGKVFVLLPGSNYKDGPILVQASAKRHPEDRDDPMTGELLVTARLYEKVAKRLYREARGRIKHADDMAAEKARRGVYAGVNQAERYKKSVHG